MAGGNFHQVTRHNRHNTHPRLPVERKQNYTPKRFAPPSSIQIQGYSQHAKAEVREGKELSLTCIVPHARPAARVVWYRANVEYKSGKRVNFEFHLLNYFITIVLTSQ
uniref:Ig-like domain-containing protein n=1 Tax=Anopheles maculatus TaxID=74869 RepID=A0A182SU73_9DIPT